MSLLEQLQGYKPWRKVYHNLEDSINKRSEWTVDQATSAYQEAQKKGIAENPKQLLAQWCHARAGGVSTKGVLVFDTVMTKFGGQGYRSVVSLNFLPGCPKFEGDAQNKKEAEQAAAAKAAAAFADEIAAETTAAKSEKLGKKKRKVEQNREKRSTTGPSDPTAEVASQPTLREDSSPPLPPWRRPGAIPEAAQTWRRPGAIPEAAQMWMMPGAIPDAAQMRRMPGAIPDAVQMMQSASSALSASQCPEKKPEAAEADDTAQKEVLERRAAARAAALKAKETRYQERLLVAKKQVEAFRAEAERQSELAVREQVQQEMKHKEELKRLQEQVWQAKQQASAIESQYLQQVSQQQRRCATLVQQVSQLQEKQATATSSSACCICKDQPATHVILPCGHMCACAECILQVNHKCPICKGPMQSHHRVYQA